MIENRFLLWLNWIMERGWDSVKFDAESLCPKCNRQKRAERGECQKEGNHVRI